MNDEHFMKEALKEAEIALHEGNFPIGCVIVLDNKVIARGHNVGFTAKNRLAHGELLALQEAQNILEAHRGKAILYSTYEPCPMCFGAIVLSKIKRVVIGINIDDSGALHLQDHLPPFWKQEKFHFEVTRGVLAKECQEIFLKGKPIQKLMSQYDLKLVT